MRASGSGNRHRGAAEPHHPGEVRRQGRLSRHSGHLRQEASAAAVEGGRRPLRESERRAGQGRWSNSASPTRKAADLAVGAEIKAGPFEAGAIVDVTGTTIGKGFAGTMKRHNFAGRMPRTVSRCRTARRAPSASARRRAACSRASACPATWACVRRTIENLKGRRDRRRAQPAADQRRGPGRRRRPGHRASVGEGRARRRSARRSRRPSSRCQDRDAGQEISGCHEHETQSQQWWRRARGFRRRSSARNSTRRWCTRSSPPIATPVARAPRRQKTKAEVRGGGRKPRKQKGGGASAPARSAARSGSAVAAPSPRSRATSRRRSTEDVPRRDAVDAVRARAPGSPGGHESFTRRRAEDQAGRRAAQEARASSTC